MKMISRIIYLLKRDYSGIVDFYTETKQELDPKYGTRTITRSKVRVRRCIVLDSKSMLKYFTRNEGSFDKEVRFFIVERKDFPTNYSLDKDKYIIYDHRLYKIDEIEKFGDGYLIQGIKTLNSSAIKEFHEGYSTQAIVFTDVAEGEL
jgi:hypothetical protein